MDGGFETPDEGQILFEDKDITSLPPYLRPINTVFQKYALFPHMNIYENIAFGLRIKNIARAMDKKRVERCLNWLI